MKEENPTKSSLMMMEIGSMVGGNELYWGRGKDMDQELNGILPSTHHDLRVPTGPIESRIGEPFVRYYLVILVWVRELRYD